MTETTRAVIGYERVLDRRQHFSRTVALGPRQIRMLVALRLRCQRIRKLSLRHWLIWH